MPLLSETITGLDDIPLEGALGTVYDKLTGAPVQLYSDAALTIEIGNPLVADVNGAISCYVLAGIYRLHVEAVDYTAQDVTVVLSGDTPASSNNVRTITATGAVVATDDIVYINATADIILSLPLISAVTQGHLYKIKNKSAFLVTFSTPDMATINGVAASLMTLSQAGESLTISFDGTGWQTLA